ncbi:MAG: hypothetical protein A2Z04_00700 [Chloroflexi bacterium RBG_16_57_9]|nr:MAG: hypothetical protein A2Z04_00700 [Chloroflexi bacterium RBG_16_57_9]
MPAQTVRVLVDGQPYTVEIEDPQAMPLTVRVDGKTFAIELPPASTAPVSTVLQVRALGDGQPPGLLPGDGKRLPAATQPAARPDTVSTSTVNAPMPGTILAIFVQAGQRVAYKQNLCVLEAMKMKNVIRAPREGIIAEVRVNPGQTVAYGDVLLIIG